MRAPAIVVSPWTAGRGVQSQIFDHSSVLQFLEQVTKNLVSGGVPRPNISAWRRSVFGDLTSVFACANPVSATAVQGLVPWNQSITEFTHAAVPVAANRLKPMPARISRPLFAGLADRQILRDHHAGRLVRSGAGEGALWRRALFGSHPVGHNLRFHIHLRPGVSEPRRGLPASTGRPGCSRRHVPLYRGRDGERLHFYSRERHLKDIVERAWSERLRVAVLVRDEDEYIPRRIVLFPSPYPFWPRPNGPSIQRDVRQANRTGLVAAQLHADRAHFSRGHDHAVVAPEFGGQHRRADAAGAERVEAPEPAVETPRRRLDLALDDVEDRHRRAGRAAAISVVDPEGYAAKTKWPKCA
jgi:hypothetical protein